MKYVCLQKNNKGFTLIELITVMGIIAVLFSIVLIAFNPAKQFGRAHNTERRSDIVAILNAVGAYTAGNNGILPSAITTSVLSITSTSGGADICSLLVPKYISALPVDPALNTNDITSCTNYSTGYTIVKDANNRVTVAAPNQEYGEVISITH